MYDVAMKSAPILLLGALVGGVVVYMFFNVRLQAEFDYAAKLRGRIHELESRVEANSTR